MRLNAGPEVTHTTAWNVGRNLAMSLAAAALITGCGSRSGGTATTEAPAKKITRKAGNPADELSRTMVSAVAANKPSTLPVQVKFELRARPDIGQPVDVDLAIVPLSASVDRVAGKVEGEDGLELLEGGQIEPTDRPAEGVPIRHPVKVLPKREGIFTVHAVLTVDSGGQSSTESYSVPVIAAASAPEEPGKPRGSSPAAGAVAPAASARVGESAHPTAHGSAAAAQ